MRLHITLGWKYWCLTFVLLGMRLTDWPGALWVAMAVCLVQVVHYAVLESSLSAFSVQVRMAYLGLLLAGLWGPLRFLHGIQLVGTWAVLVFDYCLLARIMALMPWNRRVPLTAGLIGRALFSRPTSSILDQVNTASAASKTAPMSA